MDTHFETLSALLDGEPIEIDDLEAVLEQPAARRALVDFVRLRQVTRPDVATPRAGFDERVQRALSRRRRFTRLRVPLPLAAAAVLLALLGGSLLDVKWPAVNREQVRPPQPSRVLTFDRVPGDTVGGGR